MFILQCFTVKITMSNVDGYVMVMCGIGCHNCILRISSVDMLLKIAQLGLNCSENVVPYIYYSKLVKTGRSTNNIESATKEWWT